MYLAVVVVSQDEVRNLGLFLTTENSNCIRNKLNPFIHILSISTNMGELETFHSLPEKKQNVYRDEKEIHAIESKQPDYGKVSSTIMVHLF